MHNGEHGLQRAMHLCHLHRHGVQPEKPHSAILPARGQPPSNESYTKNATKLATRKLKDLHVRIFRLFPLFQLFPLFPLFPFRHSQREQYDFSRFPQHYAPPGVNIAQLNETLSKLAASLEKPFDIKVLEEEQQELNENLISAQILASQLDRVFTLFQENLALSKADSLADDANLPFLNNLTDMLEDLDIKLLGIKPKPRMDKITYFKAPYIITLECTFDQFGKFLAEIERSPRLITVDEFEVKNGIERIKANTEEDRLIYQEFVVNLSTITLVKSKSKVSS